jgi:hypothetical protein
MKITFSEELSQGQPYPEQQLSIPAQTFPSWLTIKHIAISITSTEGD